MHKIERKASGYLLTFGGVMSAEEMKEWVAESRRALESEKGGFCVIVDMRTLAPIGADVQGIMISGQQLYKASGMTRSSVIVNNAITAIQFQRLARESGIYAWERYFDGAAPGCFEAAIAWGRDAIDPDK